ncbi:MAG: hypothetical protein RBR86_07385 [Pseudobdellovibrionaceae bacterium]|jgi:intracellular multiplication protein IcmG|nr:hypothetical protein [Pseudobdellovibrionaceae bacterium]
MADKDLQDQYEDDFDSNDSEYFDEFDDSDPAADNGDWDEMDEDIGEDYQQPAPQKKKSSFLTYVIIGVVVLGGGAFALSQMGGGEDVAGTEIADAEIPVDDVAQAASSEVPTETLGDVGASPEAPESSGSDVIAQMPIPDPAPAPALESNGVSSAPSESSFVQLTPEMQAADLAQDSTPSLPEAGGGLMTVPDMAATQETNVPAPIVMADEESKDQRPNDFPSVDMIKRTDKQVSVIVPQDQVSEPMMPGEGGTPLSVQAESDVPAVAPQVAPAPVVQSDASGTAPANEDIMKVEMRKAVDQIAELQSTVEKQEVQQSDYLNQISDLKQQISDLEAKLARSSERAAASAATSSSKSYSAPQATTVAHSSRVEKSPSWILKSAQKSRALLSREGQKDIRTVSVGDKVSGLGTILSIEQSQAGWVVVGTSGRLAE